jgi:hypothetical protein
MTSAHITRFCLIRHGETDWNGEKRIQGHIDIDLNAAGEAQARELRRGLSEHSFAAAYSSDLLRAWHTALIATADLAIAVSPAPTLRERHFGVLQGITSQEASVQRPDVFHHHRARTPDYGKIRGLFRSAGRRHVAVLRQSSPRHFSGSQNVFQAKYPCQDRSRSLGRHPERKPPPGRPHRADRLGEHRLPRRAGGAGLVMTNKYAEGYPGKRYYGGCQYVDIAENWPSSGRKSCSAPMPTSSPIPARR